MVLVAREVEVSHMQFSCERERTMCSWVRSFVHTLRVHVVVPRSRPSPELQ